MSNENDPEVITLKKFVTYINGIIEKHPDMGDYPIVNPFPVDESKRMFFDDDIVDFHQIRFSTWEDLNL